MRFLYALVLIISFSTPSFGADVQYGFLVGEYELVGKKPNGELYSGTSTFVETADGLDIVRTINNIKTAATGRFELITSDNIKVLKVKFTEDKKDYEVTYQLHSTAGNYPVLTGHVYLPTASNMDELGLETLFYKE